MVETAYFIATIISSENFKTIRLSCIDRDVWENNPDAFFKEISYAIKELFPNLANEEIILFITDIDKQN